MKKIDTTIRLEKAEKVKTILQYSYQHLKGTEYSKEDFDKINLSLETIQNLNFALYYTMAVFKNNNYAFYLYGRNDFYIMPSKAREFNIPKIKEDLINKSPQLLNEQEIETLSCDAYYYLFTSEEDLYSPLDKISDEVKNEYDFAFICEAIKNKKLSEHQSWMLIRHPNPFIRKAVFLSSSLEIQLWAKDNDPNEYNKNFFKATLKSKGVSIHSTYHQKKIS